MADIDFRLRNHGVTLTILEWDDVGEVLPSYHLDEVWVHVTRVPHAWRHYLGFWALGSVIGVTLEVDMLTYRKKGVIRMLVGMLSRELLPFSTDIVFGKFGYDIVFSVEKSGFVPAALPTNKDDPSNGGDDGFDKVNNNNGDNPDQTAKKLKNSVANTGSNPSPSVGGSSCTPMQLAVVPFGHGPVQRYNSLVFDEANCFPEVATTQSRNSTSSVENSVSSEILTRIIKPASLMGRSSLIQQFLLSMNAQSVLNLSRRNPWSHWPSTEDEMHMNPGVSSCMQFMSVLWSEGRDSVLEASGQAEKKMGKCLARLIKSTLDMLSSKSIPADERAPVWDSSLDKHPINYPLVQRMTGHGNGVFDVVLGVDGKLVSSMAPRLPGPPKSNGLKGMRGWVLMV